MAKDLSTIPWHGVARQEIPWFPTVIAEACIGCEICYLTCGREVYDIEVSETGRRKAIAARPYNCMVGCSTCAVVCPTVAITFPSRDLVWKVEREHKIFKMVHAEAKGKREKSEAQTDRQRAVQNLPTHTPRVTVRVAGVFGDRQLVMKLEALIKDSPYDIENLQLSIPTLKGLMQQAPAHMSFEVVSTEQRDVHPVMDDLKKLVADCDLVWVEQP